MRVALLSDIHGNAPALEAVLDDVEAQEAEQIWFLGDILGYGPLPVACINLLDRWKPDVWLMGNHDRGGLLVWEGVDIDNPGIRKMAPSFAERQVFAWHALQLRVGLPEERVEQLRNVPTWRWVNDEILAVHGAVLSEDPDDVQNIDSNAYCRPRGHVPDSMLDTVREIDGETLPRLILVGHTHWPAVGKAGGWKKPRSWKWEDSLDLYRNEDGLRSLSDSPDTPVLVCPGSVGQPRRVEGDQRAAYAMLDLKQGTVRFRRVEYNAGEFEAAMVLVPSSDSPQRPRWWSIVEACLAVT